MIDNYDRALLHEVQRDDGRTAEQLAGVVALSPSALARRLRRLRTEGWIGRTIALIGERLTEGRVRALVLVQLKEHADRAGKQALLRRLSDADDVQFVYEISGTSDFALLLDARSMDALVSEAETLLASDPVVRRYETSFVKRTWKFAPFVRLD